MDIVSPLIANRQPTVLRKPRQRALHNPPMPSQFLRTLHTLSGYAPLDAPFSQKLARTFCRRRLCVGVHLIGALSRSASGTLNRLDRVQKLLENHRIVDIGGSADHTERDARPLDHNMALRARLCLICRVRSGSLSPLLAGTLAESREARSQSICFASPRRSKRTRCSFSHTPASCHSRKRRQQVTPLPQPISWGSISQGMPLFSTNRMPLRAALSSMRGLPPSGLGGSSGNSGSTISQNSSLTNSLAMFSTYPNSVVLKESLSILRHCILQRPGGKNLPLGAPLEGPLGLGKEDFSCVGTTRKAEAWRTPWWPSLTKKPLSV